MFFSDEKEAGLELGRYSAEISLKGIYKIFLKISSPNFVLARASNVFNTYYNPGIVEIIENKKKNNFGS